MKPPCKAAAGGRHGSVVSHFSRTRASVRELPQFDYQFSSPSLFMQDEIAFTDKWTLGRQRTRGCALGVRCPRNATDIAARASFCRLDGSRSGRHGRVCADAVHRGDGGNRSVTRLRPLSGLRAERARNASLDVTRVFGSIEVTGTVFGSVVLDPVVTKISRRWVRRISQRPGEHADGGNRAAGAIPA